MEISEVTKDKIRIILTEELDTHIRPEDISDEVPLYDGGLGLDSISIINFIVALETKFNISFDETEINANLFSNVATVANFVTQKLGGRLVA